MNKPVNIFSAVFMCCLSVMSFRVPALVEQIDVVCVSLERSQINEINQLIHESSHQ